MTARMGDNNRGHGGVVNTTQNESPSKPLKPITIANASLVP